MIKFRMALLTAFAVLAFSAVAVASASAATVEWLAGGAVIAAPLAATITGQLLLEDMGPKTDVLCSGSLLGTVGAGALDLIESVEGLEGRKEKILCSFIAAGTCEAAMAPELTAIDLPWLTELFLDEPTVVGGLIVDLILEDEGHGEPGYLLECLVAGFTIDDSCKAVESSADVKNTATDVEAEFSEENELITPAGNCSIGGTKAALIGSDEGPGLVTLNSGELLQINDNE